MLAKNVFRQHDELGTGKFQLETKILTLRNKYKLRNYLVFMIIRRENERILKIKFYLLIHDILAIPVAIVSLSKNK